MIDKLRIGQDIKAMRYEEKIIKYKEEGTVKRCWRKKEKGN